MNKDISTEITSDGDVWIELAGNRARLEREGIAALMEVLAQAMVERSLNCGVALLKSLADDDEDVSDIVPDEITKRETTDAEAELAISPGEREYLDELYGEQPLSIKSTQEKAG